LHPATRAERNRGIPRTLKSGHIAFEDFQFLAAMLSTGSQNMLDHSFSKSSAAL